MAVKKIAYDQEARERMRDGVRRVTAVYEMDRLEEGEIKVAPLWEFQFSGLSEHGDVIGAYRSTHRAPRFLERLEYFGMDQRFMEALRLDSED